MVLEMQGAGEVEACRVATGQPCASQWVPFLISTGTVDGMACRKAGQPVAGWEPFLVADLGGCTPVLMSDSSELCRIAPR